jgi:hypothetical protein
MPGLKMETVCFSETLAFTYESTWCQNPEHHHQKGHTSVFFQNGIFVEHHSLNVDPLTSIKTAHTLCHSHLPC